MKRGNSKEKDKENDKKTSEIKIVRKVKDKVDEEIEKEVENEQDNQETEEESNDDEQDEQQTKFEETTDGIEEIIVDKVPEVTVEDLEYIRFEFEDKLKLISYEITELNDLIEDKNEIIDILSAKNIDLINIDMELISNELYDSEIRLNNIATIKQFERLNELEKTKGLNMAYQVSKLFLEHAGTEARLAIPTLNLIKISLDKISEKLKFIGDD